jgi:hypothetical protein
MGKVLLRLDIPFMFEDERQVANVADDPKVELNDS